MTWKIERDGWGRGPWDSEGDEAQWVTEVGENGAMFRAEATGAWCGYVQVWEGFIVTDTIHDATHGGVTFHAEFRDPDFPKGTWVGFDCAHAGDVMPVVDALLRKADPLTYGPEGLTQHHMFANVYRTAEYTYAQVEKLARAVAHAKESCEPG